MISERMISMNKLIKSFAGRKSVCLVSAFAMCLGLGSIGCNAMNDCTPSSPNYNPATKSCDPTAIVVPGMPPAQPNPPQPNPPDPQGAPSGSNNPPSNNGPTDWDTYGLGGQWMDNGRLAC